MDTMQNIELNKAIEIARKHIPTQKKIVKESVWSRYVIVDKGGRYAVYEEASYDQPETAGLLPWHRPTGDIVGYVDLDGNFQQA